MKFLRFLDETLIPLQDALPRLRVVNDARVVRWNVDHEANWGELKKAGFKTQNKQGDCVLYFVGSEFSHAKIDDGKDLRREALPKAAVEAGERLCMWLVKRFGEGTVGYMRIAGSMVEGNDGFVISSMDLVEPEMWLTQADEKERVERFVKCILEERH